MHVCVVTSKVMMIFSVLLSIYWIIDYDEFVVRNNSFFEDACKKAI